MATYTVRPGDTLSALALRFLGNAGRWRELWHGDPRRMPVGYVIHIPEGPGNQKQIGSGTGGGDWKDINGNPVNKLNKDQQKWLANKPGPERDLALSLVQTFLSLLNYPENIDANTLMYYLISEGLTNQPNRAMERMFNLMPADMGKAAPWAKFGLDETSYHNVVGKLTQQWLDLTGSNIPIEVIDQAIKGSWNQAQLETFARGDAKTREENPWLNTGQTFQQTKEAYIASYGHAPQDDATLRAWFNFGVAFKKVGTGGLAALQPQPAGRRSDTEVR